MTALTNSAYFGHVIWK